MILTPLGHTEFLLDIMNREGENVRILVDAWLSDYAIGDLMERRVSVRLEKEKLSTIDIIYISHSHTDHLDPYTLIEIYHHANPILVLPFTLRYLETLLREYLPDAEIRFLKHRETFSYKGIEISGYMWQNPQITNEDDVMMIAISNEKELLFAEIDTIPDPYDEEVQKSLYQVCTKKQYETLCYLASRNCLEGQIPYYDLPASKRKSAREKYIAEEKEEMRSQYEKYEYEEYAHFPNIFTLPGFTRGFIGQGISYPRILSPDLADLDIFPLEELVSIEHDYAKNNSYEFPQKALLPGRQYIIEGRNIEQGRKECPIGQLIKKEKKPQESHTDMIRLYASGPLLPRDLSDEEIEDAKRSILSVLDHRFLPYWSASPVASLREVLIKNGGVYRIEFRIGDDMRIIFEYSTARSSFSEIPYEQGMPIDEDYWLLDMIDFLEGHQEMYSSFWHRLDPKRVYRLWTCLGATYMNHDLVLAKYRYHFELAREGKRVEDFVVPLITAL